VPSEVVIKGIDPQRQRTLIAENGIQGVCRGFALDYLSRRIKNELISPGMYSNEATIRQVTAAHKMFVDGKMACGSDHQLQRALGIRVSAEAGSFLMPRDAPATPSTPGTPTLHYTPLNRSLSSWDESPIGRHRRSNSAPQLTNARTAANLPAPIGTDANSSGNSSSAGSASSSSSSSSSSSASGQIETSAPWDDQNIIFFQEKSKKAAYWYVSCEFTKRDGKSESHGFALDVSDPSHPEIADSNTGVVRYTDTSSVNAILDNVNKYGSLGICTTLEVAATYSFGQESPNMTPPPEADTP
jgi:hypothetical protein